MTISLYSIAKAILRTKITYIIVQLRYFGNNLSRRSNIVIVKLRNERIRETYPYWDRMMFTFEAYLQGKTYGLS